MAGISRAVCIALILRYIGGSPIRGAVRVFANRLPVAKKIGFGGLGGLVDQVMQGGLSSVFQNPVGALSGALQGAIPATIGELKDHFMQQVVGEGGALTNVLPGNIQSLVNGLGEGGGGLLGAVDALRHHTNLLSGVQLPGDLEHGLSDLLGLALDGSNNLFEQAVGPLQQMGRLTDATGFVTALAQKVIANELTPEAALEIVTSHTSAINSVISASTGAFAAMRASAEAVALVQEAAAGLLDASLVDGEVSRAKALVESIVRPGPLATMRQAVHEWTHPPEEEDGETDGDEES